MFSNNTRGRGRAGAIRGAHARTWWARHVLGLENSGTAKHAAHSAVVAAKKTKDRYWWCVVSITSASDMTRRLSVATRPNFLPVVASESGPAKSPSPSAHQPPPSSARGP